MKKLIITFIYLLLVVPCMAEDNPDNYSKDGFPGSQLASVAEDSKPVRYAPNQIIVKFRDTTANLIEKQLVSKNSTNGLQLSSNLNELKARYRAKRFKPLFKNFKAKRQHLKNLLQKDKALLTKRQKRILKNRAKQKKNCNSSKHRKKNLSNSGSNIHI